jgi:hypothetical protein
MEQIVLKPHRVSPRLLEGSHVVEMMVTVKPCSWMQKCATVYLFITSYVSL